jgi:hypothetical protein
MWHSRIISRPTSGSLTRGITRDVPPDEIPEEIFAPFRSNAEQSFPSALRMDIAVFGVRGSRKREREREKERRGYRSVRLNNLAASETFSHFPRLDFPRSDLNFRSWPRYRAPGRLFLLLRGAGVETWPNNLSPSIRADFDGSDRS